MFAARLFEIGVFAAFGLLLILAAAIGLQVSPLAGLATFVATTVGLTLLVYNYDGWLVRRLTSDDNPLGVNLCRSGFVGRVRRATRLLPSDPRCRLCLVPFGGLGRVLGIKPSSKNPNFCRSCFEALPAKTVELEVGVPFADMRGFTSWTETHASVDVAKTLTRFYFIASRELVKDDAFVDFIGDQVMALYLVAMPSIGDRAPSVMLAGARRLVDALRTDGSALPVGIGLDFGSAQVGTLAMGDAKGFTAVGDVVNTAARLQGEAGPYDIVMSEDVYTRAPDAALNAKPKRFSLKGKARPVRAYVVSAE